MSDSAFPISYERQKRVIKMTQWVKAFSANLTTSVIPRTQGGKKT